ncbi:MAG: diguanylate cyclase [Clostridiales bacterium]|nr:diguanylate cyclase [Clostridiales bacterium]
MSKRSILIVDDSELNRALLSDMLENDYDIIEAENGSEAIRILHERELEISLMLLDIVMPEMNGFEVLEVMNQKDWIKSIPVIMISAETSSTSIDRAYDLGAVDYISRPFDERTVKHRVNSNFMLSLRQAEMTELLSSQIYQKEKDNSLMIEILSHIVEFRNGESGLHVINVNTITKMLLEALVKKTDKYPLTNQDIRTIVTASALHDIGKISVPSEILNKPGRFTPEEFAIMKQHTVEGSNMLDALPFHKDDPLVKVSYEICRWHHERYDGRGYPDGLVGEAIPISAQVVAMADVYDALTAERCYKPKIEPDKAVQMIMNGECGQFNPILTECLLEILPRLKTELKALSLESNTEAKLQETVKQILKNDSNGVSDRSITLLEKERQKFQYLSDISLEITFDYTLVPEIMVLSDFGAKRLELPVRIADPSKSDAWNKIFKPEDFARFKDLLGHTNPANSVVIDKFKFNIGGEEKWGKVIAKAMWSDAEPPQLEGAIGKIIDVDDEVKAMADFERRANHDAKTGLFNYNVAKKHIDMELAMNDGTKYVLAMFDLDNFKQANDVYGHLFGDEILMAIADRLRKNMRSTDIASRMGGDEFIFFMEYSGNYEPQIKRIFKNLTQPYKEFNIGVSMGIVTSDRYNGNYDDLFAMADEAMYIVKKNGKNSYHVYGSDENK